MREATLIVLDDAEAPADIDASLASARRTLPGVSIGRVVVLEEHEVGGWIAAQRGRRCRTAHDVLTTPQRQQPVVLDVDLPLA